MGEMMNSELRGRIERLFGRRVVDQRAVVGGFSHALRGVVEFDDGRTAFFKASVDDQTAGWLRAEHRTYAAFPDGEFLPQMLGWDDDPCLLLLDNLSDARRPPPWTRDDVERVRRSLDALHAAPVPAGTPEIGDYGDEFEGWSHIAKDPQPFLGLGLCTERWLEDTIELLVEAEGAMDKSGDSLLHLDVRSDNLAIRDRALLFDWNWACRGNPELDTAFWLPHLGFEGGPMPWEVLPGRAEAAAVVSGFFCHKAGLPIPPDGPPPEVREFQRRQGSVALKWAARELHL
jgi:hypothetical protein